MHTWRAAHSRLECEISFAERGIVRDASSICALVLSLCHSEALVLKVTVMLEL